MLAGQGGLQALWLSFGTRPSNQRADATRLALHASVAKAARYKDAIGAAQLVPGVCSR